MVRETITDKVDAPPFRSGAMAQQYDEQIQHLAAGERILTAVDGCTIVQTADGAVALTADARIALGPATHA